MNEKTPDLMYWVKEYGIEEDIRNVLADDGTEAAVSFLRTWFDGWGDAERIVEQFTC